MKIRTSFRWVLSLSLLLAASSAFARVGGGEHYTSGSSGGSHGSGGGGGDITWLVILFFQHPLVGLVLLAAFAVFAYFKYQVESGGSTRSAIERSETQARTSVSATDVAGWVGALKEKDPAFDLLNLFDNTKKLFTDLQLAWVKGNLEPTRPFLSDATFQRLNTQLRLLNSQGVRDALADLSVLDLQIIGLDHSNAFDTVHIRVKAQMRDADAPSSMSFEEATAFARKAPLEAFVEVWSFVRKPGAKTKIGADLFQGKCPNCGAPFNGGAANRCESCSAIVNSGNYDWVLAEITQGSEHVVAGAEAEGLEALRQRDPAFNVESLEDRASLCFWRWVDAQSANDVTRLAKVATPDYQAWLRKDLEGLTAQHRHRVFLECAVGAVDTRLLASNGEWDLAHVEIRWSARMGVATIGEKARDLPTVPMRWVFTLRRQAGATTSADNGMATSRCPNCSAPLSDNAATHCDYCGTALASGERDWVLQDAVAWESWRASQRHTPSTAPPGSVASKEERERLLYMMAAMAAADGVVDDKETKLLKMCAERWGIPYANVELALTAGPALFDRLVQKGSSEAELFLGQLVAMALIDGKIDRKERQMLEAAAEHLGLSDKLPQMLR